jgi:hypothetical protein
VRDSESEVESLESGVRSYSSERSRFLVGDVLGDFPNERALRLNVF